MRYGHPSIIKKILKEFNVIIMCPMGKRFFDTIYYIRFPAIMSYPKIGLCYRALSLRTFPAHYGALGRGGRDRMPIGRPRA